MFKRHVTVIALCSLGATALWAQTAELPVAASFVTSTAGQAVSQDAAIDPATATKFYALPSGCRGLCLAPTSAADGVATVDETTVVSFLADQVPSGKGLLIDARMPLDRALGYIDGSVNVPHALVLPDNPYGPEILRALGVRELNGARNFADALPLLVFDGGPTTLDAAHLITELVAVGYPADKMQYYRGGMQVWAALGLQIKED